MLYSALWRFAFLAGYGMMIIAPASGVDSSACGDRLVRGIVAVIWAATASLGVALSISSGLGIRKAFRGEAGEPTAWESATCACACAISARSVIHMLQNGEWVSIEPITMMGVYGIVAGSLASYAVPHYFELAQRADSAPREKVMQRERFLSERLIEELEKNRNLEKRILDIDARARCCVCLDAPRDTASFPCGHLSMCGACATDAIFAMLPCPKCKSRVGFVEKVIV